jgi:hypothetical protein
LRLIGYFVSKLPIVKGGHHTEKVKSEYLIRTSIHISKGPRFIFKDHKDFVRVSCELFLETVSIIKLSLEFSHVMAGRTKVRLILQVLLKDGQAGIKKIHTVLA